MLDELEQELERVRAYRAGLAEPDAATVAMARTQLMQAIGEEPRVADSNRKARPDRRRLRKLQRRRRLALAGVLSSAGVGVAGILGLTTAATPVSALATQMNQLAKVAAGQDWTGIPGPGQYLYTESRGLSETDAMNNGQECAVQFVDHRQSWIATDGSGAISEGGSDGQFTSSADAAVCAVMKVTAASVDRSGGTRFAVGGLSFPTNDWKSLSTDPSTLLTQVHARDGGPDTAGELFVNVADFMRESDVPPAIRAALYQALPLIPGVKSLGPATDPTGQSGLGVGAYRNGQLGTELIFDKQTGRLLAEEYFDDSGKMVNWTAYTAQKIVDSLPNYPLGNEVNATPSSSSTAAGSGTTNATAGTETSSTPAQAPATVTSGG